MGLGICWDGRYSYVVFGALRAGSFELVRQVFNWSGFTELYST